MESTREDALATSPWRSRFGRVGATVVGVAAVCLVVAASAGPVSSAIWGASEESSAGAPAPVVDPVVLAVVPRVPAFVQGLAFGPGGYLYESTGLYGLSSVRRVHPVDGTVVAAQPLPNDLFGEGLAVVGDRLVQLTWHAGQARVYRADDLSLLGVFEYTGEGWGLCLADRWLVMSDGSSNLSVRDPASFELLGRVRVVDDGVPVDQLNELSCVGRRVYANVWQTPWLVRIDLESGRVDRRYDLTALLRDSDGSWGVANGVAKVPGRDEFLLTGKGWTRYYRVRLP